MSKIICEAFFFAEHTTAVTQPTFISASFQAALTPWILSLGIEKHELSWSIAEVECFALSPTFQFTRSIGLYFSRDSDRREFMNSDVCCAPLFSHLQKLTVMNYSSYCNCNGIAEFVLKFQRLQKFQLLGLDGKNTSPSELISVYVKLFHARPISETLLVSVVDSFANNIEYYTRMGRIENCHDLIKQHKVIPFLVQKSVEVYRNDHGESLSTFLDAIVNSLGRSEDESTESDSVEELVPVLDLIETIVMNGDLLHPCFHQVVLHEDDYDPHQHKWVLPVTVSQLLFGCLSSANYSRIELMQRYGRTLFPELADFIFSKYDGSQDAVEALTRATSLFFGVIEDYFWADDVESNRDETGLKKMLLGGRKLLQHMSFAQITILLAEFIKLNNFWQLALAHVTYLLQCLKNYISDVASLSDELRNAVVRDVMPEFVAHNILPLCLDVVIASFDQSVSDDFTEILVECLTCSLKFLVKWDDGTAIRENFFSGDRTLKFVDFGETACDRFKEEFRIFKCDVEAILLKLLSTQEMSDEDTIVLNRQNEKVVNLKLFLRVLGVLMTLAAVDESENESSESSNNHLKRIKDLTLRFNEMDENYNIYMKENKEKIKLLKMDE